MGTATSCFGVVEFFDEPRGLGVVRCASGEELPFHCTAVADGSRRIEPGTEVHFGIGTGHLGRYEAVQLVPVRAALGSESPCVAQRSAEPPHNVHDDIGGARVVGEGRVAAPERQDG